MEALGYIFMYFLHGILPWQGLKAKTKAQKYEKITEKKLATPVEELCQNTPGKLTCFFGLEIFFLLLTEWLSIDKCIVKKLTSLENIFSFLCTDCKILPTYLFQIYEFAVFFVQFTFVKLNINKFYNFLSKYYSI
jgi:hypothetical protein